MKGKVVFDEDGKKQILPPPHENLFESRDDLRAGTISGRGLWAEPRDGKMPVQHEGKWYLVDTTAKGVYNQGRNWTAPLTAIELVQPVEFPSDLGERLTVAMLRVGAFSLEDLRRDNDKRTQFLHLVGNILSQHIEGTQDAQANQPQLGA